MRAFVVALLLAAAPAAAQEATLADPAAEARAQGLMRELRCLVCQHESIADSQAEMAVEMRVLVRERLAAGETPAEVKGYLVSRYGDWVSFQPPLSPATLALWGAPLLFLALGGLASWRLFARRKTRA